MEINGCRQYPMDQGGRTKYISITNIGDEVLILHQDQRIGIWLAGDHVPRIPGFISIDSRRYMEWQNLALEATTDTRSEEIEGKNPLVPAVKRPEYETPRAILQRPKGNVDQRQKVEASQDQDIPDCPPSDGSQPDKSPSDKSPSEMQPLDLAPVASEESDLSSIADEGSISHAVMVMEAPDRDQVTPDTWATQSLVEKTTDMEGLREEDSRGEIEGVSLDQLHPMAQDQGTLPSERGGPDLPSMMSVLPGTGHATGDPVNEKCTTSMSQKTDMDPSPVVEDQPGTSDLDLTWDSDQDYDECFRHLLIGKGNALPPAARGVVCDIDVGGARPIALKCRKLRIQFREKLADLIKGLLSARMINYSRSPWASPIVVIIKKNGVDIRLCIDYRLVNSLTQLMVYPMPLINDLLEDL
ncbi:reverse transcriptase [Phytophthora megakarya]|uniref:Reverse transcriptase n=1 Tax=Phytophthora megakarya TaxID=4795 RepID=A0A225UP77_9STRA|nr:reverse transcriptase [Phytophthora megakarya]